MDLDDYDALVVCSGQGWTKLVEGRHREVWEASLDNIDCLLDT